MSSRRYSKELRAEAVEQVVHNGRSIAEVSESLGVSIRTVYAWVGQSGYGAAGRKAKRLNLEQENVRLRTELLKVIAERDTFRDAAAHFAKAAVLGRQATKGVAKCRCTANSVALNKSKMNQLVT